MNFNNPKCSWHDNHTKWNVEEHHDLERLEPIKEPNYSTTINACIQPQKNEVGDNQYKIYKWR
jgi:hypothetical protein